LLSGEEKKLFCARQTALASLHRWLTRGGRKKDFLGDVSIPPKGKQWHLKRHTGKEKETREGEGDDKKEVFKEWRRGGRSLIYRLSAPKKFTIQTKKRG